MMADRTGRYDLEQWKRALLCRDFDLVHTQLLILDGDVTPSERAQLVQEIFTAVQQIEELTIGKLNTQDADAQPKSKKSPEDVHSEIKPVVRSRSFRRRRRGDVADLEYEPAARRRPRYRDPIPKPKDPPKNETGKRYNQCPVCGITSSVGPKTGYKDDWYCNSCRLFKLRLERKLVAGKDLPSCHHRGSDIFRCNGCRRYNLQTFWLAKRNSQTPYDLPLMSSDDETYGEAEPSDLDDVDME